MTTPPGGELTDGVDLTTGLAARAVPSTAGAAVRSTSPARTFVDFVTGADGQPVRAEYGLGAP